VRLRQGHLKEALADYDAVMRDPAKHWSSLYARGVVKLKLGDAAGGHADIDAAVKGEPYLAVRMAEIDARPWRSAGRRQRVVSTISAKPFHSPLSFFCVIDQCHCLPSHRNAVRNGPSGYSKVKTTASPPRLP